LALGHARRTADHRSMAATTDREPPARIVRPASDCPGRQAEPAGVRRVVVPVDGSPFAERSLPVASWVADTLEIPVHLVEVVGAGDGADNAIHYLDDLARRHNAASWDVARGEHPGSAIVAVSRADPLGLVCLATHGRDRSAVALGSVAMQVLDHSTEPVMLVGPQARPPCADDAPVVVAVDGTRDDRTVVRIAGEWARRMRRRLVVVTVAEPAPRPFRSDRQVRRSRGPADPEAYVAQLAADVGAGAGAANTVVDVRVVYDPISVRNGVARLVDRTASLLVLGTHRRTRALRAVLGSHAARIVHDIEVPALVVPLDAGG
jgi:nucleotide-binding universal stress UspA family protein